MVTRRSGAFEGSTSRLLGAPTAFRPRWGARLAADLAVLAAGQWLLAADGLLAIAVFGPALLASAIASDQGRDRALRAAAVATALLAMFQGFGPGPEPSWRTVAAIFGAGLVAG